MSTDYSAIATAAADAMAAKLADKPFTSSYGIDGRTFASMSYSELMAVHDWAVKMDAQQNPAASVVVAYSRPRRFS